MNFAAFRDTKLYDFLAATPLILWFGYAAMQLRPELAAGAARIAAGGAGVVVILRFFNLLASAGYDLLLVVLLVARDKPVRRADGFLPRGCGFVGTFLSVAILHLPAARLTLSFQIATDALVFGGAVLSILVLWRLGRAFSIMPEARRLVTGGPYAFARHPLYAVEFLTLMGMALQFAQPWALLLAAGVVLLLAARSVFEERVLTQAFPEYEVYRARVKRFGVI